MLAIFVFSVDGQIFPSLLSMMKGSGIQQGALLSSLFLLFPLTSGFAGYLADRVGKRGVLLVGILAMGLPFALSALTESLAARTLIVMLFGVGGGIVEGQCSALLTDLHPGRERSVINLSQTFFSAGAAAGPFLIVIAFRIRPELTPNVFLWIAAGVTLLLAVGFASVRDSRIRARSDKPVKIRRLFGDSQWRLLAIMLFLYVGAEMGTGGWLSKYGADILNMPARLAPLSLALFWTGLGLSRFLVGVIPFRFSDTGLLRAALVLTLAARAAAFTVSTPTIALVFFGFLGFGMGAVWPTIVAMAGRIYRGTSGAAVGFMVAAGALSIPIIQIVLGALSELIGLRYSLLSLGILNCLNLVLTFFVREEAVKPWTKTR